MPKFRFDQYLIIILIAIVTLFCGSQKVVAEQRVEQKIAVLQLLPVAPIPVFVASESASLASDDHLVTASAQLVANNEQKNQTNTNLPEDAKNTTLENLETPVILPISAQSAYVYDLDSASVLYQKNAHQPLSPASTTKMMTALVANRVFDPNQIVTINQAALSQGNTMKLQRGEQITVRDLLVGLLIASANDSAFALADFYNGGYVGFVDQMNQLAEELALENAHFQNPSGLDQADHHATARDLAIIGKEILNNHFFKQLVATKNRLVMDVSGKIIHRLYNTNALLDREPGIRGIKTGTTNSAGQVLVSFLERDGRKIIIVVMGSTNRYTDTKTIIDWLFANYQWQDLPVDFYNI